MGILQNTQKFHVRYGSVFTELTEVPGIVAQASELTYVIKMIYPYPGYLWHWRAELPEVPGTGMNVVQNFQKFRVRVQMSYRTYRSSL